MTKRIIFFVNLLVSLKNQRYGESLVTLGKKIIILQNSQGTQHKKDNMFVGQVLCLHFWCIWYFWCHDICLRIYWLFIIYHICNGMLLKYQAILDVIDKLKNWEVFQNGWKHKSFWRRILIHSLYTFTKWIHFMHSYDAFSEWVRYVLLDMHILKGCI